MIFDRKIAFKMPQIRAAVPDFSLKWAHLSGPELVVDEDCPKALKDQFDRDLRDLLDHEPLTKQPRDRSTLRLVQRGDQTNAA